jgi:hypothetical protein
MSGFDRKAGHMPKFQDIVFIQDSDGYAEFERYLRESWDTAMMHLLNWFHEDGEIREHEPVCMGYGDQSYDWDCFRMIWNPYHENVGLWMKLPVLRT